MNDIIELLISVITLIFSQAAIVYAIVVAIGLILLRRPISDIFVAMSKAIMGYFMLMMGLMGIIGVVVPVGLWISEAFKITGVMATFGPIFGRGSVEFGTVIGPATLIGFLLNLLLARITPIKTVHITGHLILMTSAWYALIASAWNFSTLQLILIVGIWEGIYSWIGTALTYWPMRTSKRLTKDFALGVQDMTGPPFAMVVTKFLNSVFGEDKVTAQEIPFPKSLGWLRDPSLCISTFSGIVFIIIGLLAGPEIVGPTAAAEGLDWWLYLIFTGAKFQAGILVLLYGVRMLVAELVRAFRGISEKVIPAAVPGLDYPTVYHFSQVGMLFGFLGNFFGQLIGTAIMVAIGSPIVVIPDALPAFFSGTLLGVFSDAHGGRRAAILTPLIIGIINSFLYMACYPLTGGLYGTGLVWGYTDTYTFGLAYYGIVSLLASIFGVPTA